MSDFVLHLFRIGRASWVVLLIGASIVAISTFGLDLAWMSHWPAPARFLVFTIFGMAGLIFADKAGLRTDSVGLRHPLLTPLLIGAGVAAWVVLLDCVLFREILPAAYLRIFRTVPLGLRTVAFMMRAFIENVIYRLVVMSALVWVMSKFWHTHEGWAANGSYWTAMILAQILNIGFNVTLQTPTISPVALLYDALRYVAPGVVWGFLYWRHGFTTAEIASVAAHPFLQPPLGHFLG